jgi:LysR family transcriptional regulator, low CO2-responsive transcriptional regulator
MKRSLQRLLRATPQQLRAFEAAARLLSITGAAKELHVTQPTVSVQLRELAELVGEPLFQSFGRGVRLTQAGTALQSALADIVGVWQNYESTLADLNGLVRGRLKIAAVTTAEYFIPELLGPFAASYPGIEIDLAIENRNSVVGRLEKHEDDLAVMMLPPKHLPLQALPFISNPLIVIANKKHPKAGRRTNVKALQSERWLMREVGSGTRTVTEEFFNQQDFEPRIAMSLGSNEALKHAVAANLGLGVISRIALNHSSASVRSNVVELTVTGFPIVKHWQIVWRNDYVLSAAARAFIAYVQAKANAKKRAIA